MIEYSFPSANFYYMQIRALLTKSQPSVYIQITARFGSELYDTVYKERGLTLT